MDQAASICGVKGSGLLISFTPSLSVQEVALGEAVFVVANTCKVSDKKKSAAKEFNFRVALTFLVFI